MYTHIKTSYYILFAMCAIMLIVVSDIAGIGGSTTISAVLIAGVVIRQLYANDFCKTWCIEMNEHTNQLLKELQ